MERVVLTSPSTLWFPKMATRSSHFNVQYASDHNYLRGSALKIRFISSALPETAASIVVTAVAVGAAATLLARRTKPSDTLNRPLVKIVEALVSVQNVKEKGLCLKSYQRRVLIGQECLQRTWQLDTQQGFQRNGVTAQNVLQLDLVELVEGQGKLADQAEISVAYKNFCFI